MRKSIGMLCAAALVLPGMGSVSHASQNNGSPSYRFGSGEGFCRTPQPLPDLGEEVAPDQERSGRVKRSAGVAYAGAIAEEAGDAVVVTGSRVADSSPVSARAFRSGDRSKPSAEPARSLPRPIPPRPGPPVKPQPEPQSGLLTAGEHDDLLNHELYADYVRKSGVGQKVRNLPRVDASRLLTVEVRDKKGRAVPFADVELRCSDGNTLNLKTVADGRAVFFPEHDRLSRNVSVRIKGGEWRRLIISDEAGAQTIKITARDAAAAVKKLDLALVVDVTGSMSDELRYLQAELESIVGDLRDRHRGLDIRVGFTFYRDEGDAFVTRTYPFDGDIGKARSHIAAQFAQGGGDYPEAMQDALIRAAGQDWRDDAVKTLLLVADAPPHNQDIPLTWQAAEHLRQSRVHIVPVGASGVADTAEYMMRAMAAVTQSRYTFLTEDSGIGNPKAPPAIDCYLVTRLDQLLRRVIDSQISGRRIEPEKAEIIRTVGKYDAGRCILPADFTKQQQDTKNPA
ncbi:MAG: vWA domain-containing protein [Pseudomonadota bacterium]|nr:vWA domain-containing protein [Pseudomonadota bacterium]